MRIRSLLVTAGLLVPLASAFAADPGATVDAFHKALHDNQAAAAQSLLASDVVIYEQGFFEPSREAYKGSHLKEDIDFAGATTYQVVDRHILWIGDTGAAVNSRTLTKGSFRGQTVDLVGTETMILRKAGDAWQIAHIHWSAHPADQGGN